MQIKSISIQGFRSFQDTQVLDLDRINVIVGKNNAGKSSIIRAISLIQEGYSLPFRDINVDENTSSIDMTMTCDSTNNPLGLPVGDSIVRVKLSTTNRKSGEFKFTTSIAGNPIIFVKNLDPIQGTSPHHYIVPYLSKRKAMSYNDDVSESQANQITPFLSNLAAKLGVVGVKSHPGHNAYMAACEKIIGYPIDAISIENGKRPGVYLPNGEKITIDQMGDGVPNIVAFLADLALSKNKLFLIEELENDIHPSALKELLKLIIDSSGRNQFIISTHSNIVVTHLASQDNCKLFSVSQEVALPPKSVVKEIKKLPTERMKILEDLGYAVSDFELWEGWLILEESSAEAIIRDFLIPWIFPSLNRLRTLAAGGTSKIEPAFEDFRRMILFAHLEEARGMCAWVLVDGDESGIKAIDKLKEIYKTWPADRFITFNEEQFEAYYPRDFKDKSDAVMQMRKGEDKKKAKSDLIKEVCAWLKEDRVRGIKALKESAGEVIEKLAMIQKEIESRVR